MFIKGYSSMVERWSSKSHTWVRFLLSLLRRFKFKKPYKKLKLKKINYYNFKNKNIIRFFQKKKIHTLFKQNDDNNFFNIKKFYNNFFISFYLLQYFFNNPIKVNKIFYFFKTSHYFNYNFKFHFIFYNNFINFYRFFNKSRLNLQYYINFNNFNKRFYIDNFIILNHYKNNYTNVNKFKKIESNFYTINRIKLNNLQPVVNESKASRTPLFCNFTKKTNIFFNLWIKVKFIKFFFFSNNLSFFFKKIRQFFFQKKRKKKLSELYYFFSKKHYAISRFNYNKPIFSAFVINSSEFNTYGTRTISTGDINLNQDFVMFHPSQIFIPLKNFDFVRIWTSFLNFRMYDNMFENLYSLLPFFSSKFYLKFNKLNTKALLTALPVHRYFKLKKKKKFKFKFKLKRKSKLKRKLKLNYKLLKNNLQRNQSFLFFKKFKNFQILNKFNNFSNLSTRSHHFSIPNFSSINSLINMFWSPLFFKWYLFKSNSFFLNSFKKASFSENCVNTFSLNLLKFFFYSRLELNKLNITPDSSFVYLLKKRILRVVTYRKYSLPINFWYTNTLIRFLEYCSGKKVLFKVNAFMNNALTVEEKSRCFLWSQKLKAFRRILGPRFFLTESLQIIYIALKLKDPYFLSNWILGMMRKIDFWKHRSILRYLKYVLRYFFWSIFDDLKLKGIKYQLKGKICAAGNSRTRTMVYSIGKTSYGTFSYKVLYTLNLVRTFTGVMGFKIWLFF